MFANLLSALQHDIPGLKGQLAHLWRLYGVDTQGTTNLSGSEESVIVDDPRILPSRKLAVQSRRPSEALMGCTYAHL
eukprot:1763994-Amphidinium_carterae.1